MADQPNSPKPPANLHSDLLNAALQRPIDARQPLATSELFAQLAEQAAQVQQVLATSPTLKTLGLQAAQVQQALATSPTLKTLDISRPLAEPPSRSPSASPVERPAWREAAIAVRRRTLALLIRMDPALVIRLDGAWERVVKGGPHSAAQAAHSLVEFVDWSLRTAAPHSDVMDWHQGFGRPAGEIANGRPTRALRMRYLLRERDPDGELAKAYVRHLQDLIRLLEGVKHGPPGTDRHDLAALIMSVEAALTFLFGASYRRR